MPGIVTKCPAVTTSTGNTGIPQTNLAVNIKCGTGVYGANTHSFINIAVIDIAGVKRGIGPELIVQTIGKGENNIIVIKIIIVSQAAV